MKAGYATFGFGKWNLGHCAEAYLPQSRGFDYFVGYATSGIGYKTHATEVLHKIELDIRIESDVISLQLSTVF